MKRALILLAALTPVMLGCIPAGNPTTEASTASRSPSQSPPIIQSAYDGSEARRSDSALKQSMMTRHNAARRAVNAPPLVWDNALVASAKTYADTLARTGRFQHDPANGGYNAEGENLWMGTRTAFSYDEMVNAWIDERKDYKNGIFPNNSRTGNWGDVGHYTQIIWPSTTKVGCALSSNRQNDYLVCRYSPGGNIVGRDPLKG
ncbi:CAP family protein [Parasphingorhabdus sp. DH2-15]|uniref:CAP family protein n=1 Tax=Parasphingorhabdus sp. DH2-15 TaxID=3444112 RepID=UPI003F684F6E